MTTDDIGEQGQWRFCLVITELCDRDDPYFRPRYLGDKCPTFDYLVELVDYPGEFFFVQVKGTALGYTKDPCRLRVQVSQVDVDRMVACVAPCYVVGIDIQQIGVAFILAVNEPREHVASLTTQFRLDCDALRQLRDEVHSFWSSRTMIFSGSKFRE